MWCHVTKIAPEPLSTLSKDIYCAQIHVTCCSGFAFRKCLEAVHFELVRLSQATPRQPLTDVFTLIPLQLQHLSVLRVLNHGTIACELLRQTQKIMIIQGCIIDFGSFQNDSNKIIMILTFLQARTIFFRSYSAERPCTVVRVLRPFLC